MIEAPTQDTPNLTPQQSRAARALLAWSQQDLAQKAGVATSTVADFERGRRTPVPNNADAMRTALEGAGIHFPPGGAVAGPKPPILGSRDVAGGVPLRWVDATDLGQWAERRDCQATIPTLISKLVRAAHGPAVDIHFPSDEGVQHSGWDGKTKTDRASRYVPEGIGGWEIGTQREGIAGKANEDFEKRTAAGGEIHPSDATFVFVTPRHWPKREQWAQEKRALGSWRDVRAYDATDLVHWIELYPAVGQWLATQLGKRPAGLRQLEEVWLEWSLATRWPLSQELMLADRDEDAVAVLQWLRSQASSLALQAESAEEAVAFAYAAIMQLPADTAQHYLARCLVATNADAARMLADSITSCVIVLLDPEPGLAGRLVQRGHHVLLAYGGNTDQRGDHRRLARPSREAIERALIESGIAEPRAEALARDASRSLAILRRLIPAAPGRLPRWVEDKPARGLIAALFAGGWNEDSASDKEALARLANVPYEQIVADIAPLASALDGPLRKVGTAWKVASPQDAWSLLAPYLSPADMDRFEAVALDVLGAHDPRFDMDPEERWMAATKGVRPAYSGYLRQGLGEVLILLSLFGQFASNVPDARPRVDHVVRRLLKDAPRERWWSLSRDFRLLSEAAPSTFLDAIEDSLQRNDQPIRSLFGADGGLFGGEHLSDLLWALEALAWSPANLGRVADILARLDTIDPGGTYSNRPGNSLKAIFTLWLPQTHATLSQRLRVLDRLRRSEPIAAWKLLLATLPSGRGVVSPSPHPRWRDDSPDDQEIVTYGIVRKGAEEVTSRLLEDVGLDISRWKQLLNRINHLAPDSGSAIERLNDVESRIVRRDDRAELWGALRGVLHRHREFADAEWSLSADDLAEIETIYHRLESDDPVERVSWLFKREPALPDPGVEGWQSVEEKVRIARRRAITDLLAEEDLERLFALVRAVESADLVGATLADLNIDHGLRDRVLERALCSENAHDHVLAHGLIYSTHARDKHSFALHLLNRARQGHWGDEALLAILRALPVTRWTWDQAHLAGVKIEDAYWKRIWGLWMDDGGVDDVAFMANKLIGAGRARAALHFVGRNLKKGLPSDLLVRVLQNAVREPWDTSTGDHNDTSMFQHHVAEILKFLDSAGISDDEMLQLEWAYLPVLEYSERPAKVLINALSERPSFFIEVLTAVFKPSEDSGIVDPPPAAPEHAKAVASRAYSLLHLWNRVPGTMPDGRIDGAILESWVKEARKLAATLGRADIADEKIGEALAASPVDADGIWPAVPIREVIEITRSRELETGLEIGLLNRRGMTSRSPGDGGALERELVARYRGYSKATALEWPRTSATLERIAKSYEEDARRHDENAARREWRG